MPIEVEINLRIPRVKTPVKNADGYPVNSADVRFIRDVSLLALPKPGASVYFDVAGGLSIGCEVVRADWSETRNRFIVYCQYGKRSISDDEYNALVHDPAWLMRPLL